MDTPLTMTDLYQRYKPCVLRVTVRDSKGDLAVGAGFHIGGGYLVTARHVVESKTIEGLVAHHYATSPIKVERTIYHENPAIDLAILETDFSLDYYMTKVTIKVGD